MAEPLADVREGSLTPPQLAAYLADLAERATIQRVTLKAERHAHADPQPVALAEVAQALASGAAVGAQIRYAFDGRHWCDTLLRRATSVQLVRLDVTAPP